MHHHLMTFIAGAALLAPAAAAAQSLDARVRAAAPDAAVHFTFASKPGVCGDGENIRVMRSSDDYTMTERGREYRVTSGRGGSDRMRECVEGPVRVELERTNGTITDARVRVGGATEGGSRDLGSVAPGEAVAFMLDEDVLRAAGRRAGDRMVFGSTLADTESWPLLLRTARLQDLDSRIRSSAVFWLAQEAGTRATEGLTSLVGDDSDELEVRKQAVFALSQIRSDATIDALIGIARTNREPELRKSAMFWLGQSGSPRALAFFEEVLRG